MALPWAGDPWLPKGKSGLMRPCSLVCDLGVGGG